MIVSLFATGMNTGAALIAAAILIGVSVRLAALWWGARRVFPSSKPS